MYFSFGGVPLFYLYQYETILGKISIAENGEGLTHLFLSPDFSLEDVILSETPLLKQAAFQLTEYLEGNRTTFSLPLKPEGTLFQKKVWDALQTIPYGETCTYKDIAVAIDNPNAFRAVGMANNKNPLPILIPCHRVIGIKGGLTGYSWGLEIKEILLKLEHK